MAVANILNALSNPLALAAGAAFGGATPAKTTVTPTLPPGYQSLSDLLTQRAMARLNSSTDLSGYTSNGIMGINDAYKGADTNLNASLTARGLATSPVAATGEQSLQLARAGDIAKFTNTLPLVQQQLQDQGLALGQSVLAGAPKTTTQTSGGGLSGGIQSAEEMLAYLKGKGVLGGVAGAVGGAVNTAAGATAAGMAPTVAALGEGAYGPAAESFVAGGAGTTGGIAGALHSAGTAISGAAHSAISFLASNPWTAVAAGALATALIWKNSQVHPTASKWTDTTQREFGEHLGNVVSGFDKALASGQLTKQQALVIRGQTADLINGIEQKANQFAQSEGKKGQKVIDQFHQEMTKDFGINYDRILGKMDGEITQLPNDSMTMNVPNDPTNLGWWAR